MNCFCLKNSFDFQVETCNTSVLFFTDRSEWMLEEPYILPEYFKIQVTPPGHSKKYDVLVRPLMTTPIEPKDIGLTKLQDGIYCFSVDGLDPESGGCGKSYKRKRGIFPKLACCIKQAFATLEDEFYDQVKEAEKFLKLADIAVELDNAKLAQDNFKIAKKLISRLKCNCD